jgi:hypothetical protein
MLLGNRASGEGLGSPHSCLNAMVDQMVCITYKQLVTRWMIIIDGSHTDQASVNAYWEAIEHRALCETCRDECLVNGCFGIYYMVGSSKERSR